MKLLIAADGSKYTRKTLDYLTRHRAALIDGRQLVFVHVCAGIPQHAARHMSKEVLLGESEISGLLVP